MITHRPSTGRTANGGRRARGRALRWARPALRGATVGAFLVASTAAVPAFADVPAAWGKQPPVSGFDFLLVLLLIPLAAALVISFLVALPSLVQGDRYDPTKAWLGTKEWFGGPSKGVDEPARPKPEGTGGTSARW